MSTVKVSKNSKPKVGIILKSKENYEKLKSFGYRDKNCRDYDHRFNVFPKSIYITIYDDRRIGSSPHKNGRPFIIFDTPIDIQRIYDEIWRPKQEQ